jgi:hypothetical protein
VQQERFFRKIKFAKLKIKSPSDIPLFAPILRFYGGLVDGLLRGATPKISRVKHTYSALTVTIWFADN